MGNLDKFKKILKTGTGVASVFTKGKAKSVLEMVNQGINDESDPSNSQPLRDLAEVNDAQTEVLTDHEARLRKLEARK